MRQILFVCCTAVLLAACDGHLNFPDTTMKVGYILCTDGNVMSYEDYIKSGKEAIGVVFHLNHNEETAGDGYAVYLHDLLPEAFADSIGTSQGTSADVTAYDGNENTFALFDTGDVSSPIAKQVFDIWCYGQSAYIPSVAQMRLLYAAKNDINHYIKLCSGAPLPDEPDRCWYWTSTEVKGQETSKAWLYSLGSGAMQETPKLQGHKARPIITLNR
ncbi:DUF1566 domain-containing protein [Bacteroides sp. OttesenSCG-928-J23]|nr:DUF1566 domain-containing protein [Bacteroides sp. OttesenSCG-928-J23]MDL2303752.1 DUF1566 domain-containing protein [Bacteroides sp. OttesenSCG-928-D19]